MLILATSYDGFYEGLAGWHALAVVAGVIAFAIARGEKKRQPILSVTVASLAFLFNLPASCIVLSASLSAGPIGFEWWILSSCSLISFSVLLFVLLYAVRRFKRAL